MPAVSFIELIKWTAAAQGMDIRGLVVNKFTTGFLYFYCAEIKRGGQTETNVNIYIYLYIVEGRFQELGRAHLRIFGIVP